MQHRSERCFDIDVEGIVNLKAEFAMEADEFLWLRKGEDVGADVIAALLGITNSLADASLVDTLKDILVYIKTVEII